MHCDRSAEGIAMMATILLLAQTAAAKELNFYTCAEEDRGRCNQLITVYGHKDVVLYQRAKNEPIPDECAMPSPLNRSCTACYDHICDHVTVICPEDLVPNEGECIDGSTLKLIEATPLSMERRGRHHYPLAVSFGLFLLVVAPVVSLVILSS